MDDTKHIAMCLAILKHRQVSTLEKLVHNITHVVIEYIFMQIGFFMNDQRDKDMCYMC